MLHPDVDLRSSNSDVGRYPDTDSDARVASIPVVLKPLHRKQLKVPGEDTGTASGAARLPGSAMRKCVMEARRASRWYGGITHQA